MLMSLQTICSKRHGRDISRQRGKRGIVIARPIDQCPGLSIGDPAIDRGEPPIAPIERLLAETRMGSSEARSGQSIADIGAGAFAVDGIAAGVDGIDGCWHVPCRNGGGQSNFGTAAWLTRRADDGRNWQGGVAHYRLSHALRAAPAGLYRALRRAPTQNQRHATAAWVSAMKPVCSVISTPLAMVSRASMP